MKITFLGTGTSCGVPFIGCSCEVCTSQDPRDKRLRTSILVQTDETNILMDCGPDFREQMLRSGFAQPLDAVFISHEHYDHVGGIDDLRPFSHLRDVPLYADPLCAEHLRQRLPYCLVDNKYPGIPKLILNEMHPHDTVQCGDVPVTALQVMHGKLPILGYRLGDVAYITDMTVMPDTELPLLQGIKLLIVNALRKKEHPTHQTLEQALAFRQRVASDVPTYFIHMSHDMGLHADVEETLPEGCHLAYDGLTITM